MPWPELCSGSVHGGELQRGTHGRTPRGMQQLGSVAPWGPNSCHTSGCHGTAQSLREPNAPTAGFERSSPLPRLHPGLRPQDPGQESSSLFSVTNAYRYIRKRSGLPVNKNRLQTGSVLPVPEVTPGECPGTAVTPAVHLLCGPVLGESDAQHPQDPSIHLPSLEGKKVNSSPRRFPLGENQANVF